MKESELEPGVGRAAAAVPILAAAGALWCYRISGHDAEVGAFAFVWTLCGLAIAGAIAMIAAFVAVKPVSYRGIRACFYIVVISTILGIAMWGAQSPLAFWARTFLVSVGCAVAGVILMTGLRWARGIETAATAPATVEKRGPAPAPAQRPRAATPTVRRTVKAKVAAPKAVVAQAPASTVPPAPVSQFNAELDQHAATIRAVKLFENRAAILSEISDLLRDGNALADGDKNAPNWGINYSLWRTELKNFLATTEQLLPGIEHEVYSGVTGTFEEQTRKLVANLDVADNRLRAKFQDMDYRP